jgi:hypothetical protein
MQSKAKVKKELAAETQRARSKKILTGLTEPAPDPIRGLTRERGTTFEGQ